jgi:hypothetical protein
MAAKTIQDRKIHYWAGGILAEVELSFIVASELAT